MLEAVAAFFEEQGVTPLVLSESLTGEAREAAKFHAALARQVRAHAQPCAPPCALLSGGETTVTVRGGGRGGRNCEFALALALELRGLAGVYALAVDTDGVDGTEDAAGALVTPQTLGEGRAEARRALDANDSYTLLDALGALVRTGPTLTNVNDLRILLVTE
jgi:hydroxypyruvate reductase